MPPETRSQTIREAIAVSDAPPEIAVAKEQQQQQEQPSTSVRIRQAASNQFASSSKTNRPASTRSSTPDEPPRFVIDLSLPPEQRYAEVCAAYQNEMVGLTSLFDEVVGGFVPFLSIKWLRFICRVLLRKMYDKEENAELKGISKATGVDMYLLVCFNVLLDLFMGCSSGGAPIRAGEDVASGSKMVHFRTLDWGMPSLRRVVVQLDYVPAMGEPVIASSITYAGFIGVLTGVRKGLSLSLNFRPNRIDNGKFWSDIKYVWHLVMVLLGRRRSISSTLRQFLLPQRRRGKWCSWPPFVKAGEPTTLTYEEVARKMAGGGDAPPITTTACYLCLCSGTETTIIEKDRISAKSGKSGDFIVVTNSDEDMAGYNEGMSNSEKNLPDSPMENSASDDEEHQDTLAEIVVEAQDRQQCARNNWNNMQVAKLAAAGLESNTDDMRALMQVEDVIEMVQKYPTTNECSHFACVMDPGQGTVVWCRRWIEPVSARWIRAHMSDTW